MAHKNPALLIDLQKIRHNATVITRLCARSGIQVAGVTKGFCAIPEVARAMIEGGCTMLADSRVENLQTLRNALPEVKYLLLRTPMISEVDDVVQCAEYSLNSEVAAIQALNDAAQDRRTPHRIILMIDIGDLREGVWPDQIEAAVQAILDCQALHFAGIGCNLGCYGGIIPTPESMERFLGHKRFIEDRFQIPVTLTSGGSTSGLQLVASGHMPAGINHFRIGEGILLGKSTTDHYLIPDTFQDTFVLRGEIIEANWKPSIPIGLRGQDAFGNVPVFEDHGMRRRAILALGSQDVVNVNQLMPRDASMTILGGTSDHMLVDITDAHAPYVVGDTIDFYPDYTSLLAAATSKYVRKICL